MESELSSLPSNLKRQHYQSIVKYRKEYDELKTKFNSLLLDIPQKESKN